MTSAPREIGTPCHLIAGPLGVGKTTAILEYLKNKHDDERIAVLVNDFGPNGLDKVILRDTPSSQGALDVVSVPGGCLCCTSSVYFESHLSDLARSNTIDRIIIEPSGIVMLDQMKALLMRLAQSLNLDLQPVITLLNIARFYIRYYTALPYYQMLVDEADVLVGNRCDQASQQQIDEFLEFAHALSPIKERVITTSHGLLPMEVFQPGPTQTSPKTNTSRNHIQKDHLHSDSCEWDAATLFDHQQLITTLTAWLNPEQEQRLKAVLQTEQGWNLIEIAQGELYSKPFKAQDKSRVDWIVSNPHGSGDLASRFQKTIIRQKEAS